MPRNSSSSLGLMALSALFAAVVSVPTSGQVPSAAQLQNPELETQSGQPLKPGANSFAESQAKALLESKGYSEVSKLMNDASGIWHGTATKDDKKVEVSVDFQGHVASR